MNISEENNIKESQLSKNNQTSFKQINLEDKKESKDSYKYSGNEEKKIIKIIANICT